MEYAIPYCWFSLYYSGTQVQPKGTKEFICCGDWYTLGITNE